MNKILVICGPTATGKTGLAVKLSKRFDGELVSADSRQVYRDMDIGTGKDHPRDIKISLIDVVDPNENFTVANYVDLAREVMGKIWKKGKLPVLVGGTGFYIKAVVDGIETIGIPPDWELRRKLQNFLPAGRQGKTPKLQEILKKLDSEKWKRMNKSDRNNPRRLIRAIEIAIKAKSSKLNVQSYNSRVKTSHILMIGLKALSKVLYRRIDERVDKRMKEGMVNEIKKLLVQGYSWDNSVLGETLGYQEFKGYFEGKMILTEVVQRWKYDEHNYARRQMTWFKKDERIKWFDITEIGFEKKVVELVKKWYSVV
jgi:tRNA dimethylallyltransferase